MQSYNAIWNYCVNSVNLLQFSSEIYLLVCYNKFIPNGRMAVLHERTNVRCNIQKYMAECTGDCPTKYEGDVSVWKTTRRKWGFG